MIEWTELILGIIIGLLAYPYVKRLWFWRAVFEQKTTAK